MNTICSVSISLSTGENKTNVLIRTENYHWDLANKRVLFDVKAWRTQANYDSGQDPVRVKDTNGDVITRYYYDIPQADVDKVIADDEYTEFGAKQKSHVLNSLKDMLAINLADLSVVSLF